MPVPETSAVLGVTLSKPQQHTQNVIFFPINLHAGRSPVNVGHFLQRRTDAVLGRCEMFRSDADYASRKSARRLAGLRRKRVPSSRRDYVLPRSRTSMGWEEP